MNHTQTDIAEHFDEVSADYDFWKNKNWYYYDELKRIAKEYSVVDKKILDVGCGTGTILSELPLKRGTGIDISQKMIDVARERYHDRQDLSFAAADITNFVPQEKFDTVLCFDVVEHIVDHRLLLQSLAHCINPDGKIVLSMANPLWEPILMLAEKLKMKMPEGPHHRISAKMLMKLANDVGLELLKKEERLLVPKYIPFISGFFNDYFGHLPFFKNLNFIEVFIFSLKS